MLIIRVEDYLHVKGMERKQRRWFDLKTWRFSVTKKRQVKMLVHQGEDKSRQVDAFGSMVKKFSKIKLGDLKLNLEYEGLGLKVGLYKCGGGSIYPEEIRNWWVRRCGLEENKV